MSEQTRTTKGQKRTRRSSKWQVEQTEAVLNATRKRIEWTFYGLLFALCFLAGRMVQLQATSASTRLDEDKIFVKRQVLPAPRGQILAGDGTALAVTLNEYDVAVNPRAVADKPKLARLLGETLGGDENEYLESLQKTQRSSGAKNFYVRLARHVDESRVDKLRTLMVPSKEALKKETRVERAARRVFWSPVSLEPTPRRQYPLGNFAPQLIGFTTAAGAGVDGLERAWDRELSGQNGEVVSQMDAQGRPVPGFVQEWREPVAGRSLVTTIDPEIQSSAQQVMGELVKKYKPNFATAIVMRPSTGEVVAMVTAPSFDLNHRPKNVVDLASNRCLQFAYEPGSTFKIITASAAVESVPDWQSHSFYCNGVDNVGGKPMRCWVASTSQGRHGQEDLSEGIRDSCNFCMYGFGRLMGAPTLLKYAEKFGLTEPVGLARLREANGYLASNPERWGARQLANFSFGQSMTMTPMQLVRVAATVANDGVMMKPILVKEVRDEQGKVLQRFEPEQVRRVIAPETAREVKSFMERVVREGTARKFIFVPGYKCAGKTGSAQKADGPRGYAAGKFISSFVGFVPTQKPEFVILVMADEPHGSHWGSEVCGPAFTGIAEKAMLRLRLQEGVEAPAPDAALMEKPKEKN
jgi:stage V sporulation protein D (sporulation-specific penicillin-binding protein)